MTLPACSPQKQSLGRRIARWLLALFFLAAGANHFVHTTFYVGIMPPYLPAHHELVYLSGVCEIIGGGAVLVPRLRPWAGWGLVALLIAVFPANLHMALHAELFPDIAPSFLYARLPVQGLFIWWAYWSTRTEEQPVGR